MSHGERTHSLGGGQVGGQYFGRRQTQLRAGIFKKSMGASHTEEE
jgi:hypothetical protein